MRSRNQHLKLLQRRYIGKSKKEKARILDVYFQNAGHNRKYLILKGLFPIVRDGSTEGGGGESELISPFTRLRREVQPVHS